MQNINDLLSQYRNNSKKVQISSDEVKEKFEEHMKKLKIKEQEREVERKSKILGIPSINLFGFPIPPETLTLIDKDYAKENKVVCFFKTDNVIKLGAVDPKSEGVEKIKELLSKKFNVKVDVFLISEHSFNSVFKLYASVPIFKKIETGVKITEEDLEKYKNEITDFRSLNEKIKQVNITEIITLIIAAALKSDSSDIHIEAEEKDIKVRFRIDGVLVDVAELEKNLWSKVISRIKLLSGLKINIDDKPQDGRFTINIKDEKIDVRVSTLPTAFGESVVMRILGGKAASLQFEDLGLRGNSYKILLKQIQRPQGMIITTGPTGSGKTTTLYAILNKLNNEETKIITLEDPIEYELKGINQSQIDRSKGYSFADGLRSILRQDPDVIMVGELRDFETADVAINAALTGHLVISTLHTNSASGAIPRFLAMNVKPFLLAPSLNAIIGQRLVRRICQDCKVEDVLDSDMLEKVKQILSTIPPQANEHVDLNNLKFYKGTGCDKCSGLGFKGRIGIYEILVMTKEIEQVILSGKVSEYQMQEIAVKNGMVTMVQDGLLKALDGITSVSEVFRVTE